MPLGIRLIIDFAFKKSFGSPENVLALIGLLNAILKLPDRIEEVTILNPFSYQEFEDAKQIVLDIRCRDAVGRWFNVEMQVTRQQHMTKRLMYYASRMYADQLTVGDSYGQLTSTISICLLDKPLFRDTAQAHHRFHMVDDASGRELEDAIEVHTVELTKYNIAEATIGTMSKLHQWVFLLLRAQDYTEAELRRLLPDIEFQPVITSLHTIATKTKDRQLYDQREKARRDYEGAIDGATQRGIEIGIERGEQIGLKKGNLIGTIRTLQELLGGPVTSDEELRKKPVEALQAQADDLKKRVTDRPT